MKPLSASPAITTPHIDASRTFYQTYFDARLSFDCGWYISLEFGNGISLQFMAPQAQHPVCDTAGLFFNFCVDDVDAEYQRLHALGLNLEHPPEDHPWGDRGFSIQDPNKMTLYLYSHREPAPEFKSAYLPKPADETTS